MNKITQKDSSHTVVMHHFESSRYGSDHLAAAFERALPTIRRAAARDRAPGAAGDRPLPGKRNFP
jgi:hypothetical protein